MLVVAHESGARPVVVFNKIDLCDWLASDSQVRPRYRASSLFFLLGEHPTETMTTRLVIDFLEEVLGRDRLEAVGVGLDQGFGEAVRGGTAGSEDVVLNLRPVWVAKTPSRGPRIVVRGVALAGCGREGKMSPRGSTSPRTA